MKTKLAALVAVGLLAGGFSSAMAGPKVGVFINTGGAYCPPVRPIYRCYPTSCYYPQPAFYSWGPSMVVYSSAPSYGFSPVSPILNYAGGAPVYKMSPPLVPAPPLIVSPQTTFRWRH